MSVKKNKTCFGCYNRSGGGINSICKINNCKIKFLKFCPQEIIEKYNKTEQHHTCDYYENVK